MINDVLDELIDKAMSSRVESDLEELEKRNYDKVREGYYVDGTYAMCVGVTSPLTVPLCDVTNRWEMPVSSVSWWIFEERTAVISN